MKVTKQTQIYDWPKGLGEDRPEGERLETTTDNLNNVDPSKKKKKPKGTGHLKQQAILRNQKKRVIGGLVVTLSRKTY